MTTMMKCGHAANAKMADKPVCAICLGAKSGADMVDDNPPALVGRQAQCECKKLVASNPDLAFFEFLGAGSNKAATICKTCNMYLTAHGEINENTGRPGITDHPFVPHGPFEFDRFYCGCAGWN